MTTKGHRVAAIVGPYMSGKTALFESVLLAAGAINRKGNAKDGYQVGDNSPEAKSREMGTELSIAEIDYLDDKWSLIDCPGSIELFQETINALMVADIAIVVCEPEPDKAVMVSPVLKFLDDHKIPHLLFINKVDHQGTRIREIFEALQAVSERPLILREVPIREGGEIAGLVDLVSERAYKWQEGKPSELIKIPDNLMEREAEARAEMLESLADFDDTLMEELLEDIKPEADEVFENLHKDLRDDLIVPVLFGSGEQDHGITRLLKVLRHDAPSTKETVDRLAIDCGTDAVVQVFKTLHAGHVGKLSVGRIWSGEIKDGMTFGDEKVSGLYTFMGQKQNKTATASVGQVVAMGRMEGVATGSILSSSGKVEAVEWPDTLRPLYAFAVDVENRADEVKLTGALNKLIEDDPSLSTEPCPSTNQLLLWGQGEIHLKIALDRLKNQYGLEATHEKPKVPYKETIRKGTTQHARHKKQSGGHGEFGDVHIEIAPLPRGAGFIFSDTITGGVVPKQYIPAVEQGVKEYMAKGPLGFEVVDIAVTLTDGQYHNVDSSEMAFKRAAQAAMREGMPKCQPVLLEPIFEVRIFLPNEYTSKVQRVVSGRRGQILGFDARPGWPGWDEVTVQMPQANMHDLIIEIRSLSLGVGSYLAAFDHLQELQGREADQVIAAEADEAS